MDPELTRAAAPQGDPTPQPDSMSRGRVERLLGTAVGSDGSERRPDDLIVEEPMTVQLDGIIVSTTMRTRATTSSWQRGSATPKDF